MSHFSWIKSKTNFNKNQILTNLNKIKNIKSSVYSLQNDAIPVIDLSKCDLRSSCIQKEIYDIFFDYSGVFIFKGLYSEEIMEKYNKWSENMLNEIINDKNKNHPKQKNKFLINDVVERMSQNDPELLIDIVFNKKLNLIMDIMVGFGTIGSCTGHWIQPWGDRQLSHVDYPMHVGSGKFWENSVNKLKRLTTKHQVNKILPFFSFQLLIASDKMNFINGSTEVVPGSHLIDNLDINIHNKKTYAAFEDHFINAELDKGDLLIFNRRLCHRGGKNLTKYRRNALIIQCVNLWGVGQEIINSDSVIENIKKCDKYKNLSDTKKNDILLRIKKPYPIDVKNSA